jgi:branched-chain amino acid transport system ATP-binding protein
MTELLHLSQLSSGYGNARVLEDIELSLAEGESLAVLGRNGVGKSTLLLTLMGLTRQQGGVITFNGRSLNRVPTYRRARLGLGWVPQERLVFPSITVEQNLIAVARPGPWTLTRVWQLFPRLRERAANGANQLSGGEQQMLAIGRALVTNPRLLLLDEPMEGLAPIIVQELGRAIEGFMAEGNMAVVLVEQHAKVALRLTQNAVVLDRGRIVHRARSEQLRADDALLKRLLSVA